MNKTHPHPSAYHVMTCYRRHILACKRKHGRARGIFAYREIVLEYLRCKRDVIEAKKGEKE